MCSMDNNIISQRQEGDLSDSNTTKCEQPSSVPCLAEYSAVTILKIWLFFETGLCSAALAIP